MHTDGSVFIGNHISLCLFSELDVGLAVHRGGRKMSEMGQASFEVCHSMESWISLNH